MMLKMEVVQISSKYDIMNTKVIPIALVAVIMVAGIFAFSPVQSASTVHDTLSAELDEVFDTLCQAISNDVDDFFDGEVCNLGG